MLGGLEKPLLNGALQATISFLDQNTSFGWQYSLLLPASTNLFLSPFISHHDAAIISGYGYLAGLSIYNPYFSDTQLIAKNHIPLLYVESLHKRPEFEVKN